MLRSGDRLYFTESANDIALKQDIVRSKIELRYESPIVYTRGRCINLDDLIYIRKSQGLQIPLNPSIWVTSGGYHVLELPDDSGVYLENPDISLHKITTNSAICCNFSLIGKCISMD